MCPRYKKSNRRYNVKVPKEKITFEKKLIIQSVSSIVLMLVFAIYSFMSPHPSITKFLDTTYSMDMWYTLLTDISKTVKSGSVKAVSSYLAFVESAEKRFGIEKPDSGTVKAEKSETASTQIETSVPPESTPAPPQWKMPAKGEITSTFGKRVHPVTGNEHLHQGIDIGAPCGQRVTAALEGIVYQTGSDSYNGNYIIIDHGDDIKSIYAHLDTVCVSDGDKVNTDTQIGTVGSTGISTGPHLHFEIKTGEESVNPLDFVHIEEG